MNINKVIMVIMAVSAILGCDFNKLKDPPVAVTFRSGVLSSRVMQVSNLSTGEGMEVYVYVASAENSVRSGNTVIPANTTKEFGRLELDWDFKPGDQGFVNPVKSGKKLFFMIESDTRFKTWFGLDDIPEIDIAAQVRERKIAEHEAWLKATTELESMRGRKLFVAIVEANTVREGAGLENVWPKPQGSFKDRAKETLKGWKEKIAAKIGTAKDEGAKVEDISEMKFNSSAEYFDCLFDARSMGTDKHSPYAKGVNVDVFSSAEPKEGRLPADAVRWSVLADVTEDMSDDLPVLVSANFPCEKLRSFWDGKENADEVIPLSRTGDTKDESFVMVFKGGKVKTLTAAKAKLANIYDGPFNTCTNGYNRQIQYITPHGVVNATGMIK